MLASRPFLKQFVILLYQMKVIPSRDISWTQIKSLPETLWEFWHKHMTEFIRRCVLSKNDNELCPPYCWCCFRLFTLCLKFDFFLFWTRSQSESSEQDMFSKLNWKNGGIVPLILNLGTRWGEWSALRPGRFTSGDSAPVSHSLRKLWGLRDGSGDA